MINTYHKFMKCFCHELSEELFLLLVHIACRTLPPVRALQTSQYDARDVLISLGILLGLFVGLWVARHFQQAVKGLCNKGSVIVILIYVYGTKLIKVW